MSSTSASTRPDAPATARRSKRTVARLALAGIAVTAIGAAVTTAAWTDNVFFQTETSAATFNLKGSVTGGDTGDQSIWSEADSAATALVLEAGGAVLTDLIPGAQRSVEYWVWNDSSVAATVDAPIVTLGGTLFDGRNADLVAVAPQAPATLAPGEVLSGTLTVQIPTDWDASNQGLTGSVQIQVTAQT